MKAPLHLLLLLAGFGGATLCADENFDQVMNKAALDYTERLRQASGELTAARERIAREKLPLLAAQRAAEDRMLAAESSVVKFQTLDQQSTDLRNRLTKAAANWHKNNAYLTTLAQDGLRAFADGLAPGEEGALGDRLREVQSAFDSRNESIAATSAVDAADFLLARVSQSLGGYAAPGSATIGEGNEVRAGTFAFMGPQTFFRADSGEAGVVVRLREGSLHPVAYPVNNWPAAGAAAFFQGAPGSMPADATGSKALRLKQTTGTLREHVEKGGYVAYAIILVGLFALLLALQKFIDASRLRVDDPAAVRDFLRVLAADGGGPAEGRLPTLRPAVRELFATGLQHLEEPREALEEHLQAVLLRQRLHFERRLPLLAVIATAAPLMGLLGTVVGMVKTFALITVFGTGNAGKLASGISEVLVATELGLAVAIPTLVAHGFLSQRIHRNLAVLERCALEFMTAAKPAREEVVPA